MELEAIFNLVGAFGRTGLQIMSEIDDPRVYNRFYKNALKAVDTINSIPVDKIINSENLQTGIEKE
jgi:hypothetical protein